MPPRMGESAESWEYLFTVDQLVLTSNIPTPADRKVAKERDGQSPEKEKEEEARKQMGPRLLGNTFPTFSMKLPRGPQSRLPQFATAYSLRHGSPHFNGPIENESVASTIPQPFLLHLWVAALTS
jgi:hypothetical protein